MRFQVYCEYTAGNASRTFHSTLDNAHAGFVAARKNHDVTLVTLTDINRGARLGRATRTPVTTYPTLDDAIAAMEAPVPLVQQAIVASTFVHKSKADRRASARMQGFEGDDCRECGNFTLVRNGTCLKCNTCGGTSGCS